MGRVSYTPHDPRGCSCEGSREGQHLDTSIAFECGITDDAILDSICRSSTDCDGTEHFEDRAKKIIACLYEMDLDETLVTYAFATSSADVIST